MIEVLFTLFSDAHAGVIRALVYEHGYLPVRLYREPANRADAGAIAVVSTLPGYVVGGSPVYQGNEVAGYRIGYVSRADENKLSLCEQLDRQDKPINADLRIDGSNWLLRLAGDDSLDDQDEVVPY